jgi:hypothetical protein
MEREMTTTRPQAHPCMPLAGVLIALLLSEVPAVHAPPARRADQPALGTRPAPILSRGASRFRDLNRNGRLEPYEDWRRPVDARADDLPHDTARPPYRFGFGLRYRAPTPVSRAT